MLGSRPTCSAIYPEVIAPKIIYTNPMGKYSNYSKFYDTLEGTQEEKATFVKNFIKTYSPDATSILEIACGTGNILEQLQEYKISGLDNSTDMLKIAKNKLPNVNFYELDMRNFEINQRFDVILCIYDSINHLLELNDWVETFNSVNTHLNNNGIFIFDMNTLFKLENISKRGVNFRPFDNNYLVMQVLKEEKRYKWDVKIFERKNATEYTLHEDVIYENSFDIESIKKSLSMFEILKVCASNGTELNENALRAYFVCKKRA